MNVRQYILESYSSMYDTFEKQDEIKNEMFQDFLRNNNSSFSREMKWPVLPFNEVRYVWNSYAELGFVRDSEKIEEFKDLVLDNICRLEVVTYLLGHTSADPNDDFEEHLGYPLHELFHSHHNILNPKVVKFLESELHRKGLSESSPAEKYDFCFELMKNQFTDEYCFDRKQGQWRISDYGLKPLWDLAQKLIAEDNDEKKLGFLDQVFNVIHQRTDMAANFIEGGRASFEKLSSIENR